MSTVQSLPDDATQVWVASHLTALFAPETPRSNSYDDWQDTLAVGSKGLGFSIDAGVITRVQPLVGKKRHEVWFGENQMSTRQAPVSHRALALLEGEVGKLPPTRVFHQFDVPLGGGFGTSAAGALGLLTAIRNLHDLPLTDVEIFQLAHATEVLEKGGLGDVLGLYHGGFEQRIKVGAPDVGKCRRFEELEGKFIVLVKYFSRLETKSVLSNEKSINLVKTVGSKILKALERQSSLDLDFLKKAFREFDVTVGLMNDHVLKELSRLWEQDYLAGQIMIGNAVFVLIHGDDRDAILKFRKNGYVDHDIVAQTVKGVDGE